MIKNSCDMIIYITPYTNQTYKWSLFYSDAEYRCKLSDLEHDFLLFIIAQKVKSSIAGN